MLYPSFQEICLQTKLLAPVNESIADFLSKSPDPPPFLVTRAAVNILKVMLYVKNMLRHDINCLWGSVQVQHKPGCTATHYGEKYEILD